MSLKKGQKVSRVKKLAIAAIATSIIGGGAAVTLPYFVGEKVIEVIDGDTFKIANNQRIRFLTLNAPEPGFCYSKESKEALTKLILDKKVVLRNLKADKFGRVMAYVYVNGKLVDEYMVRNGYAYSMHMPGDEKTNIKVANEYARANHLGIFSEQCYQKEPPNPKCIIKGNISESNQKNYLTPDCYEYPRTVVEKYKGDEWFCTEEEAIKAGFRKVPTCPR